MKMPDKHTIDKVLRNAASKEEAKRRSFVGLPHRKDVPIWRI